MAITKIHAIKSTLGKALAYIENPDKTDGQMLVSGYNCEPQTASIDFEMTAVLALPSKGIERLFIPEKYVVCNAANGQCAVPLYPNHQYSYIPTSGENKRNSIQGNQLAAILGVEINPSTENTTLSRRIAAVERRMGIENAKNLGKVLLGMTSENMYTAADYDKAILSLGKKKIDLTNKISAINVEGLLQSSIQEQRPKARLDMHSIEAALSDDASFPDGKIEPGFLDRYANRIVKSNNRYIWMLQLMNVQQIMPIQSERQPIAMVTYKSGVPYDIEQEQIGKQDKESAEPDCAIICRPQDFFLDMSRTKRKRKLVEWLESCQENQVSVLDEKIPLLSFAVDFLTAYEYQKARGIKIHPGLWKDMRVDIFLVKKEN